MIDRKAAATALAKACAYKQVGKDDQAIRWLVDLVRQLGCDEILKEDVKGVFEP